MKMNWVAQQQLEEIAFFKCKTRNLLVNKPQKQEKVNKKRIH